MGQTKACLWQASFVLSLLMDEKIKWRCSVSPEVFISGEASAENCVPQHVTQFFIWGYLVLPDLQCLAGSLFSNWILMKVSEV